MINTLINKLCSFFILWISNPSENHKEKEDAIEKEYWVCYKIPLVAHVEVVFEEARRCDGRPRYDHKTEADP